MSFSRLIKYKNINNVFNKTLINNINGSLSSLGMKNNYFYVHLLLKNLKENYQVLI